MRRPSKRLVKLILGWVFIVLGVAGLFLPILQGILFLAIGLVILSQEQHWAHRLLTRLRHRFPRFAHAADEAHHKAEAWVHRVFHGRKRREAAPTTEPPANEPPDGPQA